MHVRAHTHTHTQAHTHSLVQVVQCLTEMGLSVRKARISSDGEWFVDEFIVDRVTDPKKLKAIK